MRYDQRVWVYFKSIGVPVTKLWDGFLYCTRLEIMTERPNPVCVKPRDSCFGTYPFEELGNDAIP